MARIKDVAEVAGVSVGTVDRVIHGRGNVAKEVETKVKAALDQLGYRPNLVARSLAKRAEHKIAVVLPLHDADEFWLDQSKGVRRALRDSKDFGLTGDILTFNDQLQGELLKVSPIIFNGSYEAVLIAPTATADAIELMDQCDQHQMPYVQINSNIERTGRWSLGYVGQNSYQSGQLAAKVLDFGSPDKAPLGLLHMEYQVEDSSHLLDKEAGFGDYLRGHGQHEAVVKRITDLGDQSKIVAQIASLLTDHPGIAGLFITTSRVHLVCDALKRLGRMDIPLLGFDMVRENISALQDYQRLFLINQNPSLQGFYGVKRLFDHFLKNKSVKETLHLPLDIITLENVSNYHYMQARDNVSRDKIKYD